MTITMDDSRMTSIAHLRAFEKVTRDITFRGASRKEKYAWIATALTRFRYVSLRKKERTIVKMYLIRMTGYSDAQMTRLIAKKKERE